jgi:linoleoyl-CoA desaturase
VFTVSDPVSATIPSPSAITAIWQSVLPTEAEERRARRRLHAKAAMIIALVVGSYFVLVVSDAVLVLRVLAAAVLAVALVAVGTGIMHDANHGSFSRHRWVNRTFAYSADALGASSWLWRMQHNTLHHGNTNVDGFDPDIAQAPLARLAPSQPWKPWHRMQHIYLWPLYGFLALKNLLISDVVTLVRGRMDAQPLREPVTPSVVVRVVLGKLGHIAWAVVLPLIFNPWWVVLIFYVACSWTVGFILAVIFQLAHCVDIAEFPATDETRRGDHFAAHQLRTTCDIDSPLPVIGPLFRWLAGSLDKQIEHHLAPRLPHTIYPVVARRLRDQCCAQCVMYRSHQGVWAAIRSHGRYLHMMGDKSFSG